MGTTPKIITFYSYKGGVGRTMALANAACQLATKHGLNVIAVDWDLEAPGLHYYFKYTDEELVTKKGLIDYLEDFVDEVKKGEVGSVPLLKDYLTEIKEPVKSKIEHGSVRLLTCGCTNSDYMQRVQKFDWNEFYSVNQGFEIIETLKSQLRDEADVILVDARAGQSDMGLSPTIQVPDATLLLFTSNKQSVDGTANIARRLKHHPFRTAQEIPSPILIFIPSRVFSDDDRFDRWMQKVAEPIFDRLVEESVASRIDQPKGLKQCILGVEPRFTFDEALPVIETEHYESTLREAYAQLARAITDLLEGRRMWDSERSLPESISLNEDNLLIKQSIKELSVEDQKSYNELRQKLKDAAIRGDDHKAAFYRYELSKLSVKCGNYQSAEVLLESALTYNTNANNNEATNAILLTLAQVARAQKNYVQALEYLEKRLELEKATKNLTNLTFTYYEMGLLKIDSGNPDQALLAFNLSKKNSKQIKDPRYIAQINNGLALAYYGTKQLAMAKKYALKFLDESKANSIPDDILTASTALTIIYQAQRNYSDALEAANATLSYATSINSLFDIAQVHGIIGDIYVELGDYKAALDSYNKNLVVVNKLGDKDWAKRLKARMNTLKKVNNI